MNIIKKYQLARPYIAILGLDVLFFAFFSPTGSTWTIIPALILVIATLWLLIRGIIGVVNRIMPLRPIIQKRLIRLLVIAASLIVALQSIGQLTAKDVLTIVPLVAVLYLYLSYTGIASSQR